MTAQFPLTAFRLSAVFSKGRSFRKNWKQPEGCFGKFLGKALP
jgi:hypothetical protein